MIEKYPNVLLSSVGSFESISGSWWYRIMHVVRLLIEHGAGVQTYGQTALDLTVANERAEKYKY
jgi:hypothetical protein